MQNIRNISASFHHLKGHITHKTSICCVFFATKIPRQDFSKYLDPSFSLYALVTPCKNSQEFNASICFKTYFGSLHKNPSTRLPKKIIAVKFKPIYCCNIGQKI